MAGWMAARGFETRIDDAGSVIGTLGSGAREILLLGHIDTVPGEIRVRQEGDILYGRGSVDAKGPLACFTVAACLCQLAPGWKITVVGAVGEEGDSRGAKRVKDDFLPDFCVIGEPSSWDHITLGYKGSAWIDYTAHRSLTHTAGQAESACDAAVRFWNSFQSQVSQYNQDKVRAFDQITSSLREMSSSGDGFMEEARLSFNLRLPPGLPVDAVLQIAKDAQEDGELRLVDGIECYRADKNTPLVRSFLAGIRAEGGKPGFLVKTGTSDMNIVGPAWNIPILAYGPGDSSLDHTPNEHISISEYLAGIRVLVKTIEHLQASA